MKRSAIIGSSAPAVPDDGGGEYEVFLSFRGEDTRRGFTDFIYTYLFDAGIRTFRDSNELRVGGEIGPELVKAIKESKISIPIFSKSYASSKWCLRELQQMVECHIHMGQKIFPIFYDVDPSEVRNQRGSYEHAFRKHHKNVGNDEIVQGWKEALRKVGELSGLQLDKDFAGDERELVKKIVEMVLIELKKDYAVVPANVVGIDHQKEELMRMLNVDDSNDVRIVGIHGMGGIGKTTIAKVVYNELSWRFESCCFLKDVRETSQRHMGLVILQNQLISKIVKWKCPSIVDVDQGVHMIKDRVCRKRVLIVLDDVDDKFQFDTLAGKRDWFCPGSRIIVTTRKKEVLDLLNVCSSYEPPLMNIDHSLELFCKYAFMRDHPPAGYDILSNRAVNTAAGLPLALEVIGLSLYGKDKWEWEDILSKLEVDIGKTELPVTSSCLSPKGKFRQFSIGSWQKGAFLGSGSFGTVYEGYIDDGFFCAVKEVSLLDNVSQSQESVVQLEQEIYLLSQFEHENIVRYFGTSKDEARLYIFLELVAKGSLLSLYRNFTLRDSQASSYTRQILNGLKYLHERTVVHRDIKCANILIDTSGSVKLADFGLAKATKLNDIKSCKGTAFWMAPEVVMSKENGYGIAADIWSLGCTVLEMLTRERPYPHLEWMQAILKIGNSEPPPVPDSLSREARDFICKCLQVNPVDRPTAAELLEHSFVKRPQQANSSPASLRYFAAQHHSGSTFMIKDI